MTVTAEQILAEAGEILADPEHWHKGSYQNDDGTAFCALGAIGHAYTQHGIMDRYDVLSTYRLNSQATYVLEEILAEYYPDMASDGRVVVPVWNDVRERQHSEVVEMFEKARALAAEKGL